MDGAGEGRGTMQKKKKKKEKKKRKEGKKGRRRGDDGATTVRGDEKRTTGWKSDRRKRIHRCLPENSLPHRSTFPIV